MYEVGQVLYVILEKKRVILPVMVSEQIVRRTMTGEDISYKVEIPGQESHVYLSDLGKSHYSSLSEVKDDLLQNASKSISTMCDKAKKVAQEFFKVPDEGIVLPVSSPSAPSDQNDSDQSAKVDLGDGLVANVDLSKLGEIQAP